MVCRVVAALLRKAHEPMHRTGELIGLLVNRQLYSGQAGSLATSGDRVLRFENARQAAVRGGITRPRRHVARALLLC